MVCLEQIASDVGKTDWEQLDHTLDQLQNNLIHLSLVSFDPLESCIISLWMFDFQAYFVQ